MNSLSLGSRPMLASKARLKWDENSKRHMLLFPEAALLLNDSAAATLKLCDGRLAVREIIEQLVTAFSGASREVISEQVMELLSRLAEKKLVEF